MKVFVSSDSLPVKMGQDRSAYKFSSSTIESVFAIADGIGSVPKAELAADALVHQAVIEYLDTPIKSLDLFSTLKDYLTENKIPGASTLIIGKTKEDQVIFSWCGNGCILHARGHFWQKGERDFPFALTNLMNPHIDGKGALYRFISADCTVEQAIPSQLQMSLDTLTGDIFLIGTDGLGSIEELMVGKDNEGHLWEERPSAWAILLEKLHFFLISNCDNQYDFQKALEQLNHTILDELKERGLLTDDIALGIIITEKVLEYYKNIGQNG